jgi:hypothetical protein
LSDNLACTMKFCKNLQRVVDISDPEWAPYWTNYKMLKVGSLSPFSFFTRRINESAFSFFSTTTQRVSDMDTRPIV